MHSRELRQAAIEDGSLLPELSEVLERIEEDEKRDPERPAVVPDLSRMLADIEKEDEEEQEFEKVRHLLPDLEGKRPEWTLAVRGPVRDVPLQNPAIQVLQEMYPDRDLAPRDALESFEVATSQHEPTDDGYISSMAARRAEAAAGEREWLNWKAKYDMKRRLRMEGWTRKLPAAPKNAKIGSLSSSSQDSGGSGWAASSSGSGSGGRSRGVGGPPSAPLVRSAVPVEPWSRTSEAWRQPEPQEELERQERARLQKERLHRLKERRRRHETEQEEV
mmetsp:Transcript_58034/g.180021  ORF Transcript_58034/g.180021 Transcript_58034/m.180021 type:complete len:276 (+) Transcript_58034:191-1018(+)